jgi:hypothetical protein
MGESFPTPRRCRQDYLAGLAAAARVAADVLKASASPAGPRLLARSAAAGRARLAASRRQRHSAFASPLPRRRGRGG